MMRPALLLASVLALVLGSTAAAVGPSLPDVSGPVTGANEVSYLTRLHGTGTLLTRRVEGRATAATTLPGAWGIPLVTLSGGERGGLSPDGRVLVLGSNVRPDGTLRAHSRFAVVDTRTLALTSTISLRGDYSFDALSPDARWLYLIHHVRSTDNRYQVQAYDVRAGRLLPGVIVDKREGGWTMAGYPISRATAADGRWVYTLYQHSGSYPFVHALDTVNRAAVCVDLPWESADSGMDIGTAKLTLSGHLLRIAGGTAHFAIDTSTLRLVKR